MPAPISGNLDADNDVRTDVIVPDDDEDIEFEGQTDGTLAADIVPEDRMVYNSEWQPASSDNPHGSIHAEILPAPTVQLTGVSPVPPAATDETPRISRDRI